MLVLILILSIVYLLVNFFSSNNVEHFNNDADVQRFEDTLNENEKKIYNKTIIKFRENKEYMKSLDEFIQNVGFDNADEAMVVHKSIKFQINKNHPVDDFAKEVKKYTEEEYGTNDEDNENNENNTFEFLKNKFRLK